MKGKPSKPQNSLELVQKARTSAPNFGLSNDQIVDQLSKWLRLCNFTVREANEDSLTLEFNSLPEDVEAFAQEIYDFCADVVDQGTACIPEFLESGTETVDPKIQILVEGVDLESPNAGVAILANKLRKEMRLDLWWD